MSKEQPLTIREANFAMAYVGEANGDAMASYRLAYSVAKSKATTISTAASKVLGRPHVAAEIARLRAKIVDRFEIGRADVMRRWWDIATCDVRQIIQAERRCCRHCHGVGFAYQWRDQAEWLEELAEAMTIAEAKKDATPVLPTDAGGYGFNHTLAPVEECPKCCGDGELFVMVADSRTLTGAAAAVYNGVKQTRDGIEVKLLDRDAALVNLAKALQIFGDDDTKKPGNTFNFNFTANVSPQEAVKAYRQLMGP